MSTKKPIADFLRERLSDVAERGRVLGQALKVRADMAATRRRLRLTFAELGEEAHARLADGRLQEDARLAALRQRLDGLKAEVRLREEELRDIMKGGLRSASEGSSPPVAPPAATDADASGDAPDPGPASAGS